VPFIPELKKSGRRITTFPEDPLESGILRESPPATRQGCAAVGPAGHAGKVFVPGAAEMAAVDPVCVMAPLIAAWSSPWVSSSGR
jgi:hypothetical protein